MKITIKYRKTAKPIILNSNERTIGAIATDCAIQITKRYKHYLSNNKIIRTEKQLTRYLLGQKFLIMAALESMR